MFSRHVVKHLSAFCNSELGVDDTREVAEHLLACNRCRAHYEEIKLGVRLAELVPQLSAPDSLWLNIESRLDSGTSVMVSERASLFPFSGWQRALAWSFAALVLAVGISLVWIFTRPRATPPSWQVARVAGAPRIGSDQIAENGRLAVGEWLETDGSSRAKIEVSSIGQVQIDPNTRVRLVATKPTEHRLELAHGKMSATIWAPPRLFFVDTPAAVAADLGCAYTLEVDDSGDGLLHVTAGWVELQLKDRESLVPAGASCATRPGVGPGTPYFSDASEVFKTSLARVDFESNEDHLGYVTPLEMLLRDARVRDTLSLWHLLARVDGVRRSRVYDRMAELVPPPAGVTREGVLQLNDEMLQLWKDRLAERWNGNSGGEVRKAMVDVWTRTLGKVNGLQGKR